MEDSTNSKSLMLLFVILIGLVVFFFLYNSSLGTLLKQQPSLEELEAEKGPDGQPIIFWRIKQEDRSAITKMLDVGYDIETKGGFDATPVIGASLIDDWITVLLLLERGANPLVADQRGFTIADIANTSRVDPNGRYGIALMQVRSFLKNQNADRVYEPPQVKEMLKNGEWPPEQDE